MSESDSDEGQSPESQRYYATPEEQRLLVMFLQTYFSFPERSHERGCFARQVSDYLKMFSTHWTHRAVRLWFNNNRHTYFNPDLKVFYFPPKITQQMPIHQVSPAQQPMASIPAPTPVPLPVQSSISPPPTLQAPPIAKPPPPPVEPPPQAFPIKAPSMESMSATLRLILSGIYSGTTEKSNVAYMISEFDKICSQIISDSGNCLAEKVEDSSSFTRFPQMSDHSPDFPEPDTIPESISSNLFSEMSSRPLSSRIEDAVFPIADNYSTTNIWQQRRYTDRQLPSFECASINSDFAVLSCPTLTGQGRYIDFFGYRGSQSQKTRHKVDINSRIEAIAADNSITWLLSDSNVYSLSSDSGKQNGPATLPKLHGLSTLSSYAEKAVVSDTSSSSIFYVDRAMSIDQVKTGYEGIRCMRTINDSIICSPLKTLSPRLISADGKEIRAFVGHCNEVLEIETLCNNCFCSKSDDRTVRIWDIRQAKPSAVILYGRMTPASMAGNEKYLVCSFNSGALGVIDIRQPSAKPILGIQTQDYVGSWMYYNGDEDTLSMIGLAEKEQIPESMVFVDDQGQSRKRILRIYAGLVRPQPSEK